MNEIDQDLPKMLIEDDNEEKLNKTQESFSK